MVAGVLILTLLTITTTHACNFLKRDLKCSDEWGYLSTNGPHTWSKIKDTCSYGNSMGHQTPINIGAEVPREKGSRSGSGRKFALPRGAYELLNNGHSLQVSSVTPTFTAVGSGTELGGEVWMFEQVIPPLC
jgi:carbonic anhydrase